MLDTTYNVETPEGIDLRAQAAGPVPRILAYGVDVFYRTLILTGLGIALAFADRAGMGLWLLCSFLLEWFYPVYFEVLRGGQTPGKKAFGLMVVNDNLTPISWGASLLRNLLRFADFLPFAYAAGVICMTLGRNFQRLGDLAAGTLVVYQQPQRSHTSLPEVSPLAPPRGLQLQDQQALVSLTERHAELSEARQCELADLLEPITGKRGRAGLDYLRAVGSWLLGGQGAGK
ncbi:RDD family protein [Microbulbifer magnicolonia]|uniref:RDD family protein n=1 Tax=Microbulbifer magnicolonia TaxID=3109744 RepID=UPI002B4071FC|nr:RDD family protein [Microbulbifer sp. GG15]